MNVPTVSSIGERALIDRIGRRCPKTRDDVRVGIGDDAAVIRPERGTEQVITTDSLVEGVHFRRDWTPPDAIGHKALAVNLSDLAAMGARPTVALLSLALPPDMPLADFDGLVDGFAALAESTDVSLVGGNLTASPGPLVVDVTAIGVARPRRLLRRGGASAGSALYVTGQVGLAAAGLGLLASGRDRASLTSAEARCVERYERPSPRIRLASIVARTGAAEAAMDLSDGLADAAASIADASGVGIVVGLDSVPVDSGARAFFESAGLDPLHAAVAAGEDYELAFAVARRQEHRFRAAVRRCAGLAVTRVGRFVPGGGAFVEHHGTRTLLGGPSFSHFRA